MLRYSEDSLDRYSRILRNDVRADIENARSFLGEMGSRNDWTAPEMVRIRSEINSARNRLRNNVNLTEGISTALGNTRSVFRERFRVRRDAFGNFPGAANNRNTAASLLQRAAVAAVTVSAVVVFPPAGWIINIGLGLQRR